MLSIGLLLLLCLSGSVVGDVFSVDEEVLVHLEQTLKEQMHLPGGFDYYVQDGAEFEYVVVGAGAAGCAGAARLALAGRSVLLLEAGGEPLLRSWIPGAQLSLGNTEMDWNYPTIPNNVSCLYSSGKKCRFRRGRALGGSTALNGMLYVRGNRADYDLRLPGWTWDQLEPYFLRSERLNDLSSLPESSKPYHNTTGMMDVGFCPYPENPWRSRIVKGFESLGFPFNPDVNAESQIGVTRLLTYIKNGTRVSTARGYLYRDDVRRALRVSTGSYVTRVILDEHAVARAVTAVSGAGREFTVRASRGVVLSAGTVGTPQILMLSGVGPAPHLRERAVTPRVSLPVGENMSDHSTLKVYIQVNSEQLESAGSGGAEAAARYAASRDGPFASKGLTDINMFANTNCYDVKSRRLNTSSSECKLPTLQLIFYAVNAKLLDAQLYSQIKAGNKSRAVLLALPVVLTPKSRGWVRLASADPLQPPEIFPNYLADERDVEEMLRAITILEHLVETPAYRALDASIVHPSLPGCPDYASDRAGYWSCYARHMTGTSYHAVGTCALGSVLGARLGVLGTRALHVADLSALPVVPRGNTATVAIALGERLADFLLEDDSRPLEDVRRRLNLTHTFSHCKHTAG